MSRHSSMDLRTERGGQHDQLRAGSETRGRSTYTCFRKTFLSTSIDSRDSIEMTSSLSSTGFAHVVRRSRAADFIIERWGQAFHSQ